jgi:putative phosphoesterase
MKAAILGDIHANLPALEAVLAHARGQGVDATWNIGDFVGYGAFPEGVVQRVRDEGILSIIGNYDRKVLSFPRKKEKWQQSKRAEKYLAFQWAFENLSEDSRQYLAGLPKEIRLEIAGWRILLVHGSPASDKEHLMPDTPVERLRELAQMAQTDIVIMGHSHRAFARQVDGTWFINTGSVGRPDDGDPRACYAVLAIEAESLHVRHYRIDYDVERAAAAVREHGLPEAFARMVIHGLDLDTELGEHAED